MTSSSLLPVLVLLSATAGLMFVAWLAVAVPELLASRRRRSTFVLNTVRYARTV